jgi:hypothetical protein
VPPQRSFTEKSHLFHTNCRNGRGRGSNPGHLRGRQRRKPLSYPLRHALNLSYIELTHSLSNIHVGSSCDNAFLALPYVSMQYTISLLLDLSYCVSVLPPLSLSHSHHIVFMSPLPIDCCKVMKARQPATLIILCDALDACMRACMHSRSLHLLSRRTNDYKPWHRRPI